jgi:Tol biopolymer transport system component/cytosine/adenosine deaminase-related metal-dependent hydrolase
MAPDGTTLVIDLLGQLWSLPATGGGATPLTSADERARHPRFSPDGRFVVYQREIDGQWDLWLLTFATGERRPLTATIINEREPDFTPDGRSVVFAGDITAHYCLWSIDVASGVLTQLTEEPGDASFPAVGPRGEIAYVLERDGRFSLRVLATTGAAAEITGGEAKINAPTWRPGGNVLVYGVRNGTRPGRLEMLIQSDPPVRKSVSGAEDIFESRAAWASPGEIVYVADGRLWRRELAVPERSPVHLFAAVAVTAHEAPATLGALDAARQPVPVRGINGLTATRDGRRIAFTALGDLWLRERGAPRRLTDDAYVDRDPAFTPDGDAVIFSSDRAGQLDLWKLDIASGRATPLTFGAGKSYAPAVSEDGRRVAFLETDGLGPWAPARLRVLELANPTNVTTFGSPVVAAAGPKWHEDGSLTIGIAGSTDANGARRGPSTAKFDARGRQLDVVTASVGAVPPLEAAAADMELEWQSPPSTDEFVLQVGRLFDGVRTEYLRHMDIHVADGRIVAIVGRGLRPARGRIIEAIEATVVPGFVDVHVHQSSLAGERLGRAWLAFGVTTVRELTDDASEALERGEAWASGRMLGPRLVISAGEHSPDSEPRGGVSALPVIPYPSIADGLAHGLAARDGTATAAGSAVLPEIAHGNAGSYGLALSPGLVSYQDGLARLIASATVFPSNLGAVQGGMVRGAPTRAEDAYRALFDALERSRWSAPGIAPEAMPALRSTVARLIRSGGRVAIGTDAPAVPYGLGLHVELAALAAAGIPNDQVLRLATIEGALALGLETEIGTLEEGKLADFLVIDGDPLQNIAQAVQIRAVVKGGAWLERERLLARP